MTLKPGYVVEFSVKQKDPKANKIVGVLHGKTLVELDAKKKEAVRSFSEIGAKVNFRSLLIVKKRRL